MAVAGEVSLGMYVGYVLCHYVYTSDNIPIAVPKFPGR
jgi:hypothetical protein